MKAKLKPGEKCWVRSSFSFAKLFPAVYVKAKGPKRAVVRLTEGPKKGQEMDVDARRVC